MLAGESACAAAANWCLLVPDHGAEGNPDLENVGTHEYYTAAGDGRGAEK